MTLECKSDTQTILRKDWVSLVSDLYFGLQIPVALKLPVTFRNLSRDYKHKR